jgi:N-acylneuraminate cytidylyltransferase/CMP-N,N'-diacetyllegionaminic acid synthase
MDVTAVITARGGSKSIPGKNIALVGGKPLIAWTIEAALRSPSLARVLVSTDDPGIRKVAIKWGAEAPFLRPDELAQDESPHIPVVIHAVDWLETMEKQKLDYVLLLQPTNPFRTTEDIESSIQLIIEKDGDSVVSVCEALSHPYLVKRIGDDGKLHPFIPTPEGYLARQTLPAAYVLNGAIYLVKRDVIMNQKTFHTDRTYAYLMPAERSLDIDTPWDLYVADLVLKDRKRT